MNLRKALVIDDDDVARSLIREILEKEGFDITTASSGEKALLLAKNQTFPVVISDIRMVEMDGLGVLQHFQTHYPRSIVILMTAFGSMDTALEAIKGGAFDYLSKPFKIEDLLSVVRKALKQAEYLQSPQTSTQPSNEGFKKIQALIGSSPKMLEIFKTLARAAMSNASVLIQGESGTGKELIARAIHENSNRKKRSFVAVNCGSLSESLLESELFGHLKGSFTGALENRKGIFEEANGGTLFLDEIGDISAQLQVKLLRVLQEGEIRPVGSNDNRPVDVRIVAATHRNLAEAVQEEKFREDLLYRLKVVTLEIPPLRERQDDIPELIEHFIQKYALKNQKQISHFTSQAMKLMVQYQWPGNVRELENVVERSIALTNTSQIDVEDLPIEVRENRNNTAVTAPTLEAQEPSSPTLEDMEKRHILQVLQSVQYNKSKAAEKLGIDRATLYRKAQKYGISLNEKG